MKTIYVDTSVLIAKYKPKDESFEASQKILERRKFKSIISHISLIELVSVISRQFIYFRFEGEVAERMQILNPKEKVLFSLYPPLLQDCFTGNTFLSKLSDLSG